ncbi:TDRD5 protein, partial [Galbula dea]|nr:TDRD5 protein [Galbula dea]
MANQAQLMEVLKEEVRSLLIDAKGGLTPAQLEQEYLAMVGKPLPLRDLGFRSTMELVADMFDIVRICPDEKGTFILKAITDEATKGIAKPVARQRSARAWKHAAVKADVASPSQKFQNPYHAYKSKWVFRLSFSHLLFLLIMDHHISPTKNNSQIIFVFAAALTVEMPPLEHSCETESFHLTAEEKSEPEETQAVGLVHDETSEFHLPLIPLQPQELEQSLVEKLILAPEIPWDAVQDRSLCGLPPLEGRSMVGVLMGFVVSPSQFYIHVRISGIRDELLDMMIEMRCCYSDEDLSDRYVMPESSVQPGQLCCMMVANWCYRVIVHRVLSHQEVEVFYADYGNLETVQKSRLRFLKCCYLKLPAQAIPCSLAGVKPVKGTWSEAATLLFRKLCGSKLLVGLVDEYVNGILHLFLCDTSTKEDVYIHRILSDQGHADTCKENIPSQGFMELNPLAMYVQPHGQQENTELVEPDLRSQQESPRADKETASSKLYKDELCHQ